MIARVIDDAENIFIKKAMTNLDILPKSYIEYAATLRELQGKIMNVSRRYENRTVLLFKERKIKCGKIVIGIDIDSDLVEIVG